MGNPAPESTPPDNKIQIMLKGILELDLPQAVRSLESDTTTANVEYAIANLLMAVRKLRVVKRHLETEQHDNPNFSRMRYTPEIGSPAGDALARWYDEKDRRGESTGD